MTKVIDGLHLSCLESDLASLVAALDGLVNFNLDDFSLNDLGFLTDSNSYGFSESLIECLSLGHLK